MYEDYNMMDFHCEEKMGGQQQRDGLDSVKDVFNPFLQLKQHQDES